MASIGPGSAALPLTGWEEGIALFEACRLRWTNFVLTSGAVLLFAPVLAWNVGALDALDRSASSPRL